MCQLSLYCSVSKDDNVSFALYRGSKLISTLRNFTYLENQTDTSSLHTYTCNVSNKVSWASDTRNFTQGCQSVPESKWGTLAHSRDSTSRLTRDLGIMSHDFLTKCLGSFLSRCLAPQRHRPVLAWEDLYLPLLVEIVPVFPPNVEYVVVLCLLRFLEY